MDKGLTMFLLTTVGGGLIGFALFPVIGWWCLILSFIWGYLVAKAML